MAVAGALGAAFINIQAAGAQADQQAVLAATDAPPNGVWVDSLDLSKAPLRGARGRGGGAAGCVRPAPPPATNQPITPATVALGGMTYPHALPLITDCDLRIDLKGKATTFASMVGIDVRFPPAAAA